MQLGSIKEADQFLYDRMDSYGPVQRYLMTRMAVDRCMYEGVHWIELGGDFPRSATAGRRSPNWNPDNPKGLRATVNRIIPLIRECAAATNPSTMEVNVSPPEREMGVESAETAQVIESMLNVAIDDTGFLNVAKEANHRRCIDGAYGIGLRIKTGVQEVGEYAEPDQKISAYTFDISKLTLDPYNQNTDLCKHDYVIHTEVWTKDAIYRNFGIKLNDDELATVGEMCKLQMDMNRLSEGRLYSNLPKYSQTKGAFVHELHIKDDNSYRFGTLLIGITTAKGKETQKVQWINFDNPENPFAGNGMPKTLLHGARRSDTMWSMSDVHLVKDDQDRINLLNTLTFRQLQASAAFQWLVSEDSIKGQDKDNYRQQFNNRVGGVVFYNRGNPDRPNDPPQLVTYPQPQPFLTELSTMFEQSQRRMVHRHEVTTGTTKSHVPNETFQSALNQAGQVLGIRVQEDTLAYEGLLNVLACTYVKLAKEGTPSVLACLGRHGFDQMDFAQLSMIDESYLGGYRLKLRESSIRNISKEEKERRLETAVQFKALTPMKYRIALGELDTPLDESDKRMFAAAQKAATRVLLGEEWQPEMLGEYAEMFLGAFRDALFDKRAIQDPETKARISRAIQSQLVYTQMELGLSQPPQPAAESGGEQDGAEQEMPEDVDLGQLITSLNSGAGGVPAQPSAA